MATADPTTDPANLGFFILGGGEEQNALYTGDFVNVDVVDDLFYNTDLKAVQVGNRPAFKVPHRPQHLRALGSNSIVDSGTNVLVVTGAIFDAIQQAFQALNPQFVQLSQAALQSAEGIPAADLRLVDWPSISFILAGTQDDEIRLTCAPGSYWQTDAPAAGRAMFQIVPGQLPQSILGLPLLNNYYTVFDRSVQRTGVIRFAPLKPGQA